MVLYWSLLWRRLVIPFIWRCVISLIAFLNQLNNISKYTGVFEESANNRIEISKEGDKLFIMINGEKLKLSAESDKNILHS